MEKSPIIGPQCLQSVRTIPYNRTSMPPMRQTYHLLVDLNASKNLGYWKYRCTLGVWTYTLGVWTYTALGARRRDRCTETSCTEKGPQSKMQNHKICCQTWTGLWSLLPLNWCNWSSRGFPGGRAPGAPIVDGEKVIDDPLCQSVGFEGRWALRHTQCSSRLGLLNLWSKID